MCLVSMEIRIKALDLPGLVLQIVVSYQAGAEDGAHALEC